MLTQMDLRMTLSKKSQQLCKMILQPTAMVDSIVDENQRVE